MAGNANKYLKQLLGRDSFIDRVLGRTAAKARIVHNSLASASEMGIHGIPNSSINRARRVAKVQTGRTTQARIKAGVGGAAITSAGFLGVHKYHQHNDNKILNKIDEMYKKR